MSGPAAEFFRALADDTRLRLLERLRAGERTVGDLVDELGCPQPKVSRHLKVLREAGLVCDQRDGRHVTYALTPRRAWPAEAVAWVERLHAEGSAGAFTVAGASRVVAGEETTPRRDSSPRPRVARPAAASIATHLL